MATRKVVPRGDNEGGVGTLLKRWASGFFMNLSSAFLTITTFTVSGFVKNNTSGVISGGNAIDPGDLPVGINATKIGTGTVDNTKFGYLAGVTSDIQAQLNAQIPATKIGPGTVNDTVFGYLAGAASNLQAQIDELKARVDDHWVKYP